MSACRRASVHALSHVTTYALRGVCVCLGGTTTTTTTVRQISATMCCCKIILRSVTPLLQNNKSKILFRPLRQLLRSLRQPLFCLLLSGFPLSGPNLLPLMTTGCMPTNYPPPTHPAPEAYIHGNSWPNPRTLNHLRSKFGTQSKHRNPVIRIIPTSASLGPFNTSPVSQVDHSDRGANERASAHSCHPTQRDKYT